MNPQPFLSLLCAKVGCEVTATCAVGAVLPTVCWSVVRESLVPWLIPKTKTVILTDSQEVDCHPTWALVQSQTLYKLRSTSSMLASSEHPYRVGTVTPIMFPVTKQARRHQVTCLRLKCQVEPVLDQIFLTPKPCSLNCPGRPLTTTGWF